MILVAAVIGVLVGALAGGRIEALINIRLRYAALLFAALLVRYGTQFAITDGISAIGSTRVPLYAIAFSCLIVALWLNRSLPGILAVLVGVAANAVALLLNGGLMPVFMPAVASVGLGFSDVSSKLYTALPTDLGIPFLLHGGPFGDIIPFPVPILTNVVSIGDVLMAVGLGWLVFATMIHGNPSPVRPGVALWSGGPPPTVTADRPVMLGTGTGPGLLPPARAALARVSPIRLSSGLNVIDRLRRHPYVHLMRDARFSAFWTGQTISLFGDRLHQIALGVLVLATTGSAMETGLVFMAATLPNLVLGPMAGPFVDRWDQKRVMIVSDLLRAGLVLMIPAVCQFNILLVYPVVFLVTTVSLFFRPAKSAVVPRLVEPDDLLAANSATWTGETLADIAGYPLAGVLVACLGTQLWVAFWMDAASYLVSAVLLLAVFVPPVARAAVPRGAGAVKRFMRELRDGWRVLRRNPALFQNTIVSAIAQFSVGTTLALAILYGRDVLDGRFIPYPQNYAAIDAAIGFGNLIGGFAVSALGAKTRKGWLVVIGFIAMGLSTMLMGLTQNVLIAMAAALGMGIFNLVYIIPTQTLFAELTPVGYLGRVVAFRSSLVFGSMTLAMAIGSVAAERISVGLIIAVSGAIMTGAGVVGAMLPAVRNPDGVVSGTVIAQLPARAYAEDG